MNIALAIATLATGVAYSALGALVFGESLYLRRSRGLSWVGMAITAMAVSCGPHHLAHGYHVLQGHDAGLPLVVTTFVALPAGITIVYLRIEALFGRRGDRFVTGTPWWLALGPVVFLVTFGALIGWTVGDRDSIGSAEQASRPAGHTGHAVAALALPDTAFDPVSVQFLTNTYAAIAYAIVGGLFARTQLRRRPVAGGWSLSGCALAGLFSTCALTHFAYAFTAGHRTSSAIFDLLGVPASTVFLCVAYAIYREALGDWNRRPLVGASTAPQRRSPWAVDTV